MSHIQWLDTAKAYNSSLEHLKDELELWDLRLSVFLLDNSQNSAAISDSGVNPSAGELIGILGLDNTAGRNRSQTEKRLKLLERRITARIEASRQENIYLSVPYICRLFNLGSFEKNCIIACLAYEVNRKYEAVYSFLQNDPMAISPGIDMLMKILTAQDTERIAARRVFDTQASLVKYLMEPRNDLADPRIPLISRHLKLDDWVVNYLLDVHLLDSRLAQIAEMVPADGSTGDSICTGLKDRLLHFVSYYKLREKDGRSQVFYFYGPDLTGKKEHVSAVCSSLGLPLVIADLEKFFASEGNFDELLLYLGRQVMVGKAALCLENADSFAKPEPGLQNKINRILQMLYSCAALTFILGKAQWNPAYTHKKFNFAAVEFPYPSAGQRKKYWDDLSRKYSLEETVNLDYLSGNFRFTRGQIEAALSLGENISVLKGTENGRIGKAELSSSCYSQSNRKLAALASKINSVYNMEMLVLPEEQMLQMYEICNQVKYRSLVYEKWGFENRLALGKGLNILFSGPPGSGKTMAAEVIANEIGLEIYKVDVSQIVSKYIGETEKNLSGIFEEAETSNAILFFDEADALFGKRSEVKDAHDRYANVETGYLLQRMEEYTGMVILATNLSQNIDEAFLRRLHFNVAFPFPDREQRKRIWQGIFPAAAPVDEKLDMDFLAEKFILAGGNIKNIAVNAAFYAAQSSCSIGIKQIMLAAKREYKKLGKTFLKSDFAPYYQLIEEMK